MKRIVAVLAAGAATATAQTAAAKPVAARASIERIEDPLLGTVPPAGPAGGAVILDRGPGRGQCR
ncbi:hypothetical protein [Kitasatospora purpeofusca]|uniref:Uncharacterized protein n=1 Tax=Kitasatospora purpeofusca TaxID=67352 RepID=A0ABZ1TRZ0_9ACTN|nr:hypothetical protein [Kitasatospora purpeofusca]